MSLRSIRATGYWMCRPVLPRLMTVLQTAAFLFRRGMIFAAA
jgi:hypothetical protein